MRRTLAAAVSLAMVVGACGLDPISETEYVEELNTLVADVSSELGGSVATFEQIANPTLADFVSFVEEQLVVEYEVRDWFESLDTPKSLEEVHQVMFDTLLRILAVAEGVLDAAADVTTMEELAQTAEFAAYYTVNADADSMCFDVQSMINDLAARPGLDSPWIADLRSTVRAFLDCAA